MRMLSARDLIALRECSLSLLRLAQSDSFWHQLYDDKYALASSDMNISSIYKAPLDPVGWMSKYRKSYLIYRKSVLLSSYRMIRMQSADLLRSEQEFIRKEAYLDYQRSTFVVKQANIDQERQEQQLQRAQKVWLPSPVRAGLRSSSSKAEPSSTINDTAIQQIDSLKATLRNSREEVMKSRASLTQEMNKMNDELKQIDQMLVDEWPKLPLKYWSPK